MADLLAQTLSEEVSEAGFNPALLARFSQLIHRDDRCKSMNRDYTLVFYHGPIFNRNLILYVAACTVRTVVHLALESDTVLWHPRNYHDIIIIIIIIILLLDGN